MLQRQGFAAAATEVIRTHTRTYLLSSRFDRTGISGRRHVVSIGAVHAAFVPGHYSNWSATCEALAKQGRLSEQDADTATNVLQFGRLIGNTDMHSGNASFFAHGATLAQLTKGRFSLAPVYDMLPMRWRPDGSLGAPDYAAFDVDRTRVGAIIWNAAFEFWRDLSRHPEISAPLKAVAAEMSTQF